MRRIIITILSSLFLKYNTEKNKLLILLFFSLTHALHAQSLYVEYEHTVSVVREVGDIKMNAILISENNRSHYTTFFNNEKFNSIPKVSQDENEDTSYRLFTAVDVGDSSTLIYTKKNNSISQNFLDKGRPTIINDAGVAFNWELSSETKTIQSFNCTKAKVAFRGREFIAWFTSEIPVTYGPWKFHGLPGLILEVHDVDNLFFWEATKIQYPIKLDVDLDAIHKGNNYRSLTLKQYVDEQTEQREEVEKMRRSKLPKGSKIVESKLENKGIELVYEWELVPDNRN